MIYLSNKPYAAAIVCLTVILGAYTNCGKSIGSTHRNLNASQSSAEETQGSNTPDSTSSNESDDNSSSVGDSGGFTPVDYSSPETATSQNNQTEGDQGEGSEFSDGSEEVDNQPDPDTANASGLIYLTEVPSENVEVGPSQFLAPIAIHFVSNLAIENLQIDYCRSSLTFLYLDCGEIEKSIQEGSDGKIAIVLGNPYQFDDPLGGHISLRISDGGQVQSEEITINIAVKPPVVVPPPTCGGQPDGTVRTLRNQCQRSWWEGDRTQVCINGRWVEIENTCAYPEQDDW